MAFEKFEGFVGDQKDSSPAQPTELASPNNEIVRQDPDPTDERVALQRTFHIGERHVTEILVPRAGYGLVMDIDLGRIETPLEIILALTGETELVIRTMRHDDVDRLTRCVRKALPSRIRKLI